MVCVYDARFSNRPRGASLPPVEIESPAPAAGADESPPARLRHRIAVLERRLQARDQTIARLRAIIGRRTEAAVRRTQRAYDQAAEVALQEELLRVVSAIVAQHAEIEVASLRSDRRGRRESWPRQMLCYLARTHCPLLSLPRIGKSVHKDHTTILHAVRVVQQRLDAGCVVTVGLHRACLADVKEAVRRFAERCAELEAAHGEV